MKKLMYIVVTLVAGVAFAANYKPSSYPPETTEPDVMPGLVNFQGLLREPTTGTLYTNGVYSLECRLYADIQGGKALWGGKYQAYVKDGYFNIMLGEATEALSDSGCAAPTDLWKVLWYKGNNRQLYLGVTPWQDYKNQTIADDGKRIEIAPRQQLVAAPFAFRAQKSQYADAASGDFKIAGDLTVHGSIRSGDGTAFGLKNVTATDSEVLIGNDEDSPAKTTVQGSTVLVEAGGELNVNSHGDATVTMDSDKTLHVLGNVRLAHGKKIEMTADEIDMKWGMDSANGGVTLEKSNAGTSRVSARAADVFVYSTGSSSNKGFLQLSNTGIQGKGNLKWNTASSATTAPVVVRTVTVTVAANTYGDYYELASLMSGTTVTDYRWMIVGHNADTSDHIKSMSLNYKNLSDSSKSIPARICLYFTNKASSSRTVTLVLMGVNNKWCDYNAL